MHALFAVAFFLCGYYHDGSPIGVPCPVHPTRAEFGWCATADRSAATACATNSPRRLICRQHRGRTYCDL